MKYLLHCIVKQELFEPGQGESPLDALAQGIFLVASQGLAAVVSRDAQATAPSIAQLLAYERVVESCFARQTVLPLRYGCLMESEGEILRLLEDHHDEYGALLLRLHGMTEMGIRMLWPMHAASLPRLAKSPGTAYLLSVRERYNFGDTLTVEEAELADNISTLLEHRCTDQRREVTSSSQGRLVSLAFLTPKACIEDFRNQARKIALPKGAKLLLSGPWPPYNFVTPTT